MLVLSRKVGERVYATGGIVVTIVSVNGGKVRIGFEAPSEVKFQREELVLKGNKPKPKEAK